LIAPIEDARHRTYAHARLGGHGVDTDRTLAHFNFPQPKSGTISLNRNRFHRMLQSTNIGVKCSGGFSCIQRSDEGAPKEKPRALRGATSSKLKDGQNQRFASGSQFHFVAVEVLQKFR
jgi:hypothetical protein